MALDLNLPVGLEGYVSGVVGALDFGRERLKTTIAKLQPNHLRETPLGFTNSVATLVVHICASEIKFACLLTGVAVPDDLKAEFLLDQPQSPLPMAEGETAETLAAKMGKSRAVLLNALQGLQAADLQREVVLGKAGPVTVRWALSLLPHHQGLHMGHIQMLLTQLAPPGYM